MSRLDCVRESLRLTLKELEGALTPQTRPIFWLGLWERYVESQTDYRAGSETLARKLVESGSDVWQLLEWLREPARSQWAAGPQAQLLARVFAEQFVFQASQTAPSLKEKIALQAQANHPQVQAVTNNATPLPTAVAAATQTVILAPQVTLGPNVADVETDQPEVHQTQDPTAVSGTLVQPKDKKQLASDRVQNPHDPEATYSVKGQGEKKKEHVGYKVQVAETVCEAKLAPGEPTRNFITSLMTHPAYESDEAGALQLEAQQAALGLAKPPVQYVDGAYVSAQQLAAAAAEGRELIGPAPGAPDNNQGRFTTERFEVQVEQRVALCPAGHQSTQCSRLEEGQSGKVNYRFEWSTRCAECPLRPQCVGPSQKHRTIVVGEHHSALQTRRREQDTDAFKQRMKHRNAIEGTQSELVRGHGLRHARYRGLSKVKLQNYFIGAACNVKRWFRPEAWKLRQAALVGAAQLASVTVS